jgi:phosphoribosylformylglycinamidine synthase PurS subunit
MQHERPRAYFSDPEWRKRQAPVVPPTWVIDKVKTTGEPVEWNNTQHINNCPCCEWPFLYMTELEDGEVVTRLLPGSVAPVWDWLYTPPQMLFMVVIHVRLKADVPDPHAADLGRKIRAHGIDLVEVLVGKRFGINMSGISESDVRNQASEMCEKLLANPYIEQYEVVSVRKG